MRFRLVEPRDYPTCQSLLNPAMRLSRRVTDQLPALWSTLGRHGTCSVVEDPTKPHPDCIEGFGASAFVADGFVDGFLEARRSYLDAALYESIVDGSSPVLSEEQIRDANAGDGLTLVVFNFGLRDHDLSNPVTGRVLQMGGTAFYSLHAGYRLKTIVSEVFGNQAVQYMQAGGFQLQDTGVEPVAEADVTTPRLFALRREWVRPAFINPLSSLFYPSTPRIGFSRTEQRVLMHALLNRSDAEIAEELGLSLDAIKKTWRRVYERVSRLVPYVIDGDRRSDDGSRSIEKRRHVLEYLRAHLEELRPTRRA